MLWLPQPLYNAKPVVFLLAALSLMLITKNVIVTVFAVGLTGYSLWIFFARFMWRDAGIVEWFSSIKVAQTVFQTAVPNGIGGLFALEFFKVALRTPQQNQTNSKLLLLILINWLYHFESFRGSQPAILAIIHQNAAALRSQLRDWECAHLYSSHLPGLLSHHSAAQFFRALFSE